MQIIRDMKAFYELNNQAAGKGLPVKSAVAIGKFDGIHVGHQALLQCIINKKKENMQKEQKDVFKHILLLCTFLVITFCNCVCLTFSCHFVTCKVFVICCHLIDHFTVWHDFHDTVSCCLNNLVIS